MKKYGIKIKSIVKCNDKFLIVERWYDDRIEEPYQWDFWIRILRMTSCRRLPACV